MTWPAMSAPCVLLNAPRYALPIGVRAVETMTASAMGVSLCGYDSEPHYTVRDALLRRARGGRGALGRAVHARGVGVRGRLPRVPHDQLRARRVDDARLASGHRWDVDARPRDAGRARRRRRRDGRRRYGVQP